jgi:hypothetical protein
MIQAEYNGTSIIALPENFIYSAICVTTAPSLWVLRLFSHLFGYFVALFDHMAAE